MGFCCFTPTEYSLLASATFIHATKPFFSIDLEQCPIVLRSQWGFNCETPEPEILFLNLEVHDRPGDALNIPFMFNASNPQYAHEMIRLVEQESLPLYLLTVNEGRLYFFDRRVVQIPDEFREVLAFYVRDALRSVQAETKPETA